MSMNSRQSIFYKVCPFCKRMAYIRIQRLRNHYSQSNVTRWINFTLNAFITFKTNLSFLFVLLHVQIYLHRSTTAISIFCLTCHLLLATTITTTSPRRFAISLSAPSFSPHALELHRGYSQSASLLIRIKGFVFEQVCKSR